jgi:polyketide cyclase/dehydrase/lipid transport protein
VSVVVTVVAPAALEVAWERWSDFARWPSWNPHCVEAALDGPLAPGSRLELRLRDVRGREFYTRPHLTVVEEGRRLDWEARGLGLRASTRTSLAPEPDGTRITLEASAEGRLAFAFRIGMTDRTQALIYVGMLDALTDSVRV